ncbi:ATPase WRNIP1-like [Physella acuta]|uniref:ATPase WRNIP1-like n=1 Tax=Physella acuta TaxID=109671 RepID=UPI0027DB3304|nr:ATPase WRNIP1-like [Physella acuta]
MSDKIVCPVCSQLYSSSLISDHVNSCLNSDSDKQVGSAGKKRRTSDWDFLTKPAKIKISSTSTADHDTSSSRFTKTSTKHAAGVSPKNAKINNNSDVITIDCTEEADQGVSKSSNPVPQGVVSKGVTSNVPLAERMRPQKFEDYVGQDQAVGRKSLLHTLLSQGERIPSMILWGPPGCGKTTLAKIVAQKCKDVGNIKFVAMSATSAGISDVKELAKVAKNDLKMLRRKTVLFLDEIHRFNKTQQDALLPHVEDGTITLIGATTENPSFHVNSALLSRCRVITLEKLKIDDIKAIIKRALPQLGITVVEKMEGIDVKQNSFGSSPDVYIEEAAIEVLAGLVDGDARCALNGLQLAFEGSLAGQGPHKAACISIDVIKEALQRSHVLYDKNGEEHYNIVSALIKSMRGSDASAALYWMMRMIEGGENPLFVARRLVIFASEDVGLADPLALTQAVATHQACHLIGMPECVLNLTQCVIYLSRAPKSNQVMTAMEAARACVRNHEGSLPSVPLHLRNAPTKLTKTLGYGKGYKYPPSHSGPIEQEYFPPSLVGTNFFS